MSEVSSNRSFLTGYFSFLRIGLSAQGLGIGLSAQGLGIGLSAQGLGIGLSAQGLGIGLSAQGLGIGLSQNSLSVLAAFKFKRDRFLSLLSDVFGKLLKSPSICDGRFILLFLHPHPPPSAVPFT
ncbi:hypothetical protein CEXT_136961 [Caerostris extrusa]|uniref:Uncharacterized protein n=1 Tax=Caerostris extrusa TaxID=172846 RepID=A0AAV4WV65_CAEEX|nr:hypothetical protein CEXT_136961 [Caerostris extrusa]